MSPAKIIVALWVGWAVSWALAALWATPAESCPPLRTEVRYRIPLVAGGLLMAIPAHGYEGALRFWHIGWTGVWICIAAQALGIAFAWWARLHLGALWSGRITRKADHRVVDSGPYALVRHPIYTGLLLALLSTMLAKGTLPAVAGFGCLLLGIWIKAGLEEQWLAQALDPAAYAGYRARIPMLIPFGPKRG